MAKKTKSYTGWAVHNGSKRLRIIEGEICPRIYKTKELANASGWGIGTSRLVKIRVNLEEIAK